MSEPAIEEARHAAGIGAPRRDVHVILGVFYVVAALLNGENLLRSAERMEHGRALRTVCVTAARPLAAAARALRMDAPRRAIEGWVDAALPGWH